MLTDLKASAQRVQTILTEYGLDTKVVQFPTLTRTSLEAATTIGCELGQIIKTLIFKGKTTSKPYCVIASGKNRVDEKKIQHLVGEPIERPDADFVEKHTGFAIGGVSPIGYTFETKPLIDEDLMCYKELWAAAGTPHAVFRITPMDLITITQGTIVSLKV